jgi:membrane fusion protein (multidrug efflux system)
VVDAAGQVSVKEITLGPKSGDDVVVESGLDAGETVIVEGIQKVRPGMIVEPVSAGTTTAVQG